jgi:hypothetical protein
VETHPKPLRPNGNLLHYVILKDFECGVLTQ